MDWDDFKFVHALAQGGTVRRAGKLLGVHGSTVIRRLDALERRIQVKLFRRSKDGMQPTAAGREILSTLEDVARELDSVTRRLRAADASLSGPVVLEGPELLLMVVATHMRRFRETYPGLSLELREPRCASGQADADLKICLTREPPPDLVGRHLGPLLVAVYGTPGHLLEPSPEDASAGRVWVDESAVGALTDAREAEFADMDPALATNSGAVRLAALRSGQGIGPLPCIVGDADRQLARHPGYPPRALNDMWLLSHPDLRGVARVRAAAEFVQQLFQEPQQAGR